MKIIPLGRIKQPFDLTEWDRHCLKQLGRIVPLGSRLQPEELEALGFIHAAASPEVRHARRTEAITAERRLSA